MEITIIKSKNQYNAYLKRMHEIFDAKNGTPEGDELDLLALVIEKYEDEHYPIEAPDPIKVIQFMMEQMNMNKKGFGLVIKSQSRATEILKKKRPLTLAMIRRIHGHLGIPAEILIKDYKLAN
ncbi:HTH-type transcriptional regulator / antitoxin HigA [Flaviramulus basaltis]|uniref:HTH-type transcriptional regulator / antitoxin HigA n=1 Tax=Flaviramulus basaltis TaxID=369401 RepID=A0A1K2IR89_9FLAO|nr:transcriptional regulator [Flaviramulus basaltis]SFZ94887.1 HTH-type transcriptional regulator / antitoxin HigA [Flaviramulus basaltis]